MATDVSLIFDTWTALYDTLAAATYPVWTATTEPVSVWPCATSMDEAGTQSVSVFGPEDRAAQNWFAYGGQRREETFSLLVIVQVGTPGQTGPETLARMGQICTVVEQAVRATAVDGTQPAAIADRLLIWEVSTLFPKLFMATEGFWGETEMVVTSRCLIGI